MKLKIFIALIITILMLTPSNADTNTDTGIKKQCQYVVDGKGTYAADVDMYLVGIIAGIEFMTIELTDFSEQSTYRVKKDKACENALNNNGSSGFDSDYKREVAKLISKKYADK